MLDEDDSESSLSTTILEVCGPLILLLYRRCIIYASVYEELKDLRSLFLSAAQCYTEFKKESLKSIRSKIAKRRGPERRLENSVVTDHPGIANPENTPQQAVLNDEPAQIPISNHSFNSPQANIALNLNSATRYNQTDLRSRSDE